MHHNHCKIIIMCVCVRERKKVCMCVCIISSPSTAMATVCQQMYGQYRISCRLPQSLVRYRTQDNRHHTNASDLFKGRGAERLPPPKLKFLSLDFCKLS